MGMITRVTGVLSILFACMVMSGCLAMMYKSPQMADALGYVRAHKGEGSRRVLAGSETELMNNVVKAFGTTTYRVIREAHAVYASVENDNGTLLAYAFYFYPSQVNDQTEVEILIASKWYEAKDIPTHQQNAFPMVIDQGREIERKLTENGYDPNIKEPGFSLPLSYAAMKNSREMAVKLINKGANIDSAVAELAETASKQLQYLNSPANKKAYDDANSAVAFLSGLKKAADRKRTEQENEVSFQAALHTYQAAAVKPELPESARKYKVQADSAVRDKDFAGAVNLYGQALKIAPWWPEGHFNRALVFGEMKEYDVAIIEMNRYLALVPYAANARAAQDKIYDWERFETK